MKLKDYIKDKLYAIILFIFILAIILLMLIAFKVATSLTIAIIVIFFIYCFSIFFIEYMRRKKFYDNLINNINLLDQAYLVLETLEKPEFFDGEVLYQAIYEINKSFLENINNINHKMVDFKEYIEMWIHEVKIPLASLTLMAHNHHDRYNQKFFESLRVLEFYLDQVLYYVRSENAEKDFLIKETSIKKVVNIIALKFKDDLLEKNIDVLIENINYKVYTDAKWLEFIMGQIISNSIKYLDSKKNSIVKIKVEDEKNETKLIIEDNGIGIAASDLPQVFDKSFTGQNGRKAGNLREWGFLLLKVYVLS